MNNVKYRLMQFMYGRNGIDGLGYAAMALYLVVFAVNLFVNNIFLTIVGVLIIFLIFYRMFSRDVVRRRSENEWFMWPFNKVKSFFKQTARRVKDIKTHRYRTCPGCKVTLRLPVRRGKHTAVCPRCKRRVEVRVWM